MSHEGVPYGADDTGAANIHDDPNGVAMSVFIANNQVGNNQVSNNQVSNNQVSNSQVSNSQVSRTDIGDTAFDPSAHNYAIGLTAPPEEDSVEPASYPPPSGKYHAYPPSSSFTQYSDPQQMLSYTTAPSGTLPVSYPSSSGYPTMDADGGVPYGFDQVYPATADDIPMTSSPETSSAWNHDSSAREADQYRQTQTPDGRYGRGWSGSDDSGLSTDVLQGFAGDPTEQGQYEIDPYERQRARLARYELGEESRRGYVENGEGPWSPQLPLNGFCAAATNENYSFVDEDEPAW
ncbi:hypothetical protein GGR52DRAFT_572698 [Hypoxylon sp. FL1284]|nr:hypothetical protein GGR52DRAFT_572698 [Hypoxylon sp. FL1284]